MPCLHLLPERILPYSRPRCPSSGHWHPARPTSCHRSTTRMNRHWNSLQGHSCRPFHPCIQEANRRPHHHLHPRDNHRRTRQGHPSDSRHNHSHPQECPHNRIHRWHPVHRKLHRHRGNHTRNSNLHNCRSCKPRNPCNPEPAGTTHRPSSRSHRNYPSKDWCTPDNCNRSYHHHTKQLHHNCRPRHPCSPDN